MTITVDGKKVVQPAGTLLIEALGETGRIVLESIPPGASRKITLGDLEPLQGRIGSNVNCKDRARSQPYYAVCG